LEAIEAIVAEAPAWLEPDGVLVVELAPHQAERAVELALAAGFEEAFVRHDMTARPRVLVARRSA
jgi:release factor glutamine methyltransferase